MHVIDPRGPGLVPRAVTTLGLMDPNLERRDIVLHGDALASELVLSRCPEPTMVPWWWMGGARGR